ncbi:LytS/YhcK type 5TM receptor domain-containing protein [Tepidibacillus fermentans]|uniref:histidine kinase n=1 Tax=Tepidibacillus fermentans TaxID=1281767 RepID=A0A4R3KLF5_9BACI|nr:LytS/YhcK type 5TM receptor domain-containing protein [Tepidibacillus fermentans]TCS84577.1 two-component system sensor histidine kinase LytS [Tepidibacillus fermentans]
MLQLLFLMIERIGVIVTIAFILTRFATFRNLIDHKSDRLTKIKLMILFGIFGIIGTYTGIAVEPYQGTTLWVSDVIHIQFNEAIANSRVIGVVIGGLLGGPVVGLGAGLIAAIHRMLLGGFTGLACGVSTVVEGAMAGIVYKKIGNRRIVPIGTAFFTGLVAETVQMAIILLLAKPFEKALALVQVIGLPMIVANSIGIAIFIAIIQSVVHEEDRIEADQAQKVLHVVDQTLFHLRKGLNEESAKEISKLLLKTTNASAVSITNQEKILSHVGLGDDHHTPGHSLLTEATKQVLKSGKDYVAKSFDEIRCQQPKCPLQAAIIVPIKKAGEIIGVLKFYFANQKQIRLVDRELALGLGGLLSHQIEAVEAEKQAKLVSEAEIKALQAQVNPHFLFNSLNTIVALIRTNPDLARKLLIQLGNFFRQNLNASLHELVSIGQEINHTRSYLYIEQARFFDRLQVEFQVDQEIEHVLLPPLTLQPLVENAIKHGLKGMKNGRIRINVQKQEEMVYLAVMDNGIGIDSKRIELLLNQRVRSKEGTGFGLYNVHQRLISRYGGASGLHIESEQGKGTKVWFLIPIVQKQEVSK